jgi:hypothetical protein
MRLMCLARLLTATAFLSVLGLNNAYQCFGASDDAATKKPSNAAWVLWFSGDGEDWALIQAWPEYEPCDDRRRKEMAQTKEKFEGLGNTVKSTETKLDFYNAWGDFVYDMVLPMCAG